MIERFERNRVGCDYVVGDIHGHYDLLMQELSRLGFDRECDRLFSVGDLIDRGPSSLDCLKLVFEPWCHAVRGNHEVMAKQALFDNNWRPWLANGGDWSRHYDRVSLRTTLAEAMMRMPWAMEVSLANGTVGIVHAEPPGNWATIITADREPLVWSRRHIREEDTRPVQNITAVVVGHTPVEQPRTLGNVRYIDVGSFFSGRLAIERLEDIAASITG